MPKYVVSNNEDETEEALNPDGTNAKVTFNNKDVEPKQETSRKKRAMFIALIAVCLVVVLLLVAWFIYSVVFNVTPEWQQDNYMIETIPGLRYHPDSPGSYADTLIAFNASDPASYKKWTNITENFVNGYINMSEKGAKNIVNCDYNDYPKPGKVCFTNVKNLFPCVKEEKFRFHKATPCVFIRFNKILNWVPEYYNDTANLPEEMPQKLKDLINKDYNTYKPLIKNVWLDCKGQDSADDENMGPVKYLPRQGFPGFYFPYNNTENYMSPLVALFFEKPKTGVVISIECRIWAPNIEYNKKKGTGFVNFELLID